MKKELKVKDLAGSEKSIKQIIERLNLFFTNDNKRLDKSIKQLDKILEKYSAKAGLFVKLRSNAIDQKMKREGIQYNKFFKKLQKLRKRRLQNNAEQNNLLAQLSILSQRLK